MQLYPEEQVVDVPTLARKPALLQVPPREAAPRGDRRVALEDVLPGEGHEERGEVALAGPRPHCLEVDCPHATFALQQIAAMHVAVGEDHVLPEVLAQVTVHFGRLCIQVDAQPAALVMQLAVPADGIGERRLHAASGAAAAGGATAAGLIVAVAGHLVQTSHEPGEVVDCFATAPTEGCRRNAVDPILDDGSVAGGDHLRRKAGLRQGAGERDEAVVVWAEQPDAVDLTWLLRACQLEDALALA
mmetsp:Transcript_56980/g.144604  ORF Transcript_56980/g.144604 Transcript_56980/m.144604 type:complete len:245 (+) Transcript_56980:449-1183(+)